VSVLQPCVQLTSSGVPLLDDSSLKSLESSLETELSTIPLGGGFFLFVLPVDPVAARFTLLGRMT
jgi:hypothetical protein